jgi:hypothetical protein
LNDTQDQGGCYTQLSKKPLLVVGDTAEGVKKSDIDFINKLFLAYHTGPKQSIGLRKGSQSFKITPNALDLML